MKRSYCLAAVASALAGCTSLPQMTEVKVAIPVECREQVPARPAMATESLRQGVSLTGRVNALMAEIEQREGYELQLVAALQACIKPVAP